MATKLVDVYSRASAEFGVMGRMKLAMLTKIPSERAGTEADSPANIQLFEQAFRQMRMAG